MSSEAPAGWHEVWPWLLVAGVVGWLVWLLAPILTPFVAGAALAYLGDPLVDRLERLGLGRTAAVVVVFLIMLALGGLALLGLIPLLEAQVAYLVERLPVYIEWLRGTAIPALETRFGLDLHLPQVNTLVELLQSHWRSAGGIAAAVLNSVSSGGMAVVRWVATVTLVPVVAFYLMRDWDKLIAGIRELLPRRARPVIGTLAAESDQVLSAFIRGQLLVMLALGVVYTLGLWLIGLDLALLIGSLAGLLSIVPYLGTIVGVAAALIAALVQFGDLAHLALVGVVFITGQVLEGMVLTPLLVGDRIGLHPVAVIFAVMAGGSLFGFLGVLIGLPVAAVIMVLLRHAHESYKQSRLFDPDAEARAGADPERRG